jgi:hypothetical protein
MTRVYSQAYCFRSGLYSSAGAAVAKYFETLQDTHKPWAAVAASYLWMLLRCDCCSAGAVISSFPP